MGQMGVVEGRAGERERRRKGRFAALLSAVGCLAMTAPLPTIAADRDTPTSPPKTSFPPLTDVLLRDPVNTVREAIPQGADDSAELRAFIPPARNLGDGWEMWATSWSEEEERGYQAFVTLIGRSGCISIDDCLRSEANPYRDLADERLWLGDCTDMVYVLRGYYAWKRGLPFSYASSVAAKPHPEGKRETDVRFTTSGNRVSSRIDITHRPGRAPINAPGHLTGLFAVVSTAMLRTAPTDTPGTYSDFYPVEISRDGIVAGQAIYDIYGHVSLVYDIDEMGRVSMISSHPDHTVSREFYGAHVVRSDVPLGAGFKAWRPIELVGATRTEKGTYIGGRMEPARNHALPHFSLEQFYGTHPDDSGDWRQARFEHNGRFMPYYDFVRARLRAPGVKIDPLEEVAAATNDVCDALRARKTAVSLAVFAGLPEKRGRERLPRNIYGTWGEWEEFATPSRDARIRTRALELRELVKTLITRHAEGDKEIDFPTGDLAAAIYDVYDRHAAACEINYRRSDNATVKLTMHHVMDRLFDLSFDPYHCPERRWGATGAELATCPDGEDKAQWYDAQRWLRFEHKRRYDLRMDFAADELRDPALASEEEGGIGRSTPPDVDIEAYLRGLTGGHRLAGTDLAVTILKASEALNGAEPITPTQTPRRTPRRTRLHDGSAPGQR